MFTSRNRNRVFHVMRHVGSLIVLGMVAITMVGLAIALAAAGGCAPAGTTTKINFPGVGSGEFPKDLRAELIEANGVDARGNPISVKIQNIDASASSVIAAQAAAMQAQAEAYAKLGKAVSDLAERFIPPGAIGPITPTVQATETIR